MAHWLHPVIPMENSCYKPAFGPAGGNYWATSDTSSSVGFVFHGGYNAKTTNEEYYPQAFSEQSYWQNQHENSAYWYEESQPHYKNLHTMRSVLRPETATSGDYNPNGFHTSLEHSGGYACNTSTLQGELQTATKTLDNGGVTPLSGFGQQGGGDNVGKSWPTPQTCQYVPTGSVTSGPESSPTHEVIPATDGGAHTTDTAAILADVNTAVTNEPAQGDVPRHAEWPQGNPVSGRPIIPEGGAGPDSTNQEESEGRSGRPNRPHPTVQYPEPEIIKDKLINTPSPTPAKMPRTISPGPNTPNYSDITDDEDSDDSDTDSIADALLTYTEAAQTIENPKASDEPQQFSSPLPPLPQWYASQSAISSRSSVISKHSVTSVAAISPSLHKLMRTNIELYPRPVRRPTSSNVLTKEQSKSSKGKNLVLQAQKITPGKARKSFNKSSLMQILLFNPQDGFPDITNKSKYPFSKIGPILAQEETLKPKSVFTCCSCVAHRWDIKFEDTTQVMATSITASSDGSKHLNVSTTLEYHRWDFDLPEDSPENKWHVYISYTNYDTKRITCEHYILG